MALHPAFCGTLTALIAISFPAFSQLVVVGTGFDNYAGTSATAPAGWNMSWHSTSSPSYYSTAANSGAAIPSYKMGQDSVIVISPKYMNADTLTFMCKGNGVPFADTNELHIYHSADSISWNMFVNRDSLPTAKTTLKYGLPSPNGWIMFVYRKLAGGNLAFDDVKIIAYPNIYAAFTTTGNVCAGNSICFLNVSFSNNGSINYWNWSFGDGNSSSVQNPCHTYTAAGTYSVSLIVANTGSDTDTTVVPITVNPTPFAGYSSTLTGNVVTFTNTSTGGTMYTWDFGDGNFSNLQNPNPYSYWTAGTYTICLTVTNTFSCTSVYCQSVTITTVGINETDISSSIIISPNPSNGQFSVQSSEIKVQSFEIYNLVGEKIFQKTLNPKSETINLNAGDGIYFLKLKTQAGDVTKKIIISR